MKKLGLTVLVGCLAACAAPQQINIVNIQHPFDSAQAAKMLEGNSKVTGSGFMRQRGGGVVTCAGQEVGLVPATAYATERFTALYGNLDGLVGFNRTQVKFNPDVPEYQRIRKITTCDAQGNFEFDKVGKGDFYLYTTVLWETPSVNIFGTPVMLPQGGAITMKVSLGNNENKRVVLSR